MKRGLAILAGVLVLSAVTVVVALIVLGSLLGIERAASFDRPGVLVIDLDGLLVERAPADLVGREIEGAANELFEIGLALDRAATDPRIAGVYLRIGMPGYGWAKAEEIRDRLLAFRASGKFVHAYTPFTNELGYYVALAADRIDLLPDAGLELNGFVAYAPFIRPLLEKLGIDPQVEAIGAYKSAADVFRNDSMSAEHREVVTAILLDRYDRFVDAVVEARGIDRARLVGALEKGTYFARDHRALGLIDGERYEHEVLRGVVAKARGIEEQDVDDVARHLVQVASYAADLPDPPGDVRGTIGVVYAVGTIGRGNSGYDPVFGRVMGSAETVEMLRDVARDDALDAVVIRVDSPGGDALASEEIWAAVAALSERMPVIVSMSDVAGSGGYYLAAAADEIVAAPSTITGSIGVLAVLFDASALYDRIGVRWDAVETSPGADFPTSTRPLTDAERAVFRSLVEHSYRSFVRRVADGRGLSEAAVDSVAQGRIWSGAQALEHGLVDRLGGLGTALDAAREAAGIEPGARVALHVYPARQRLIDRVRDALVLNRARTSTGAAAGSLAQLGPPGAVALLRQLGWAAAGPLVALREGPGRPLAVVPWLPVIH